MAYADKSGRLCLRRGLIRENKFWGWLASSSSFRPRLLDASSGPEGSSCLKFNYLWRDFLL